MFRLSARNVAASAVALLGLGFAVVRMLAWRSFFWGVFALIVVPIALVAYWVVTFIQQDRHRGELRALAARLGWTYAERSLTVGSGLTSYPFGHGADREDVDVISGVFQGRRCVQFTHAFAERSEDGDVRQEFQITAVELGARYPTVDVLPDDLLAKAAKLVGGMDVDFESAAFNRRWRVKGPDARYVHDMITPRVMDRLLKEDATGFAVRIEGPYVFAWRADRLPTEKLAAMLGLLTSVANALPPHVERALREAQAAEDADRAAREAAAPEWARKPGALTSGHYTALGAQEWAEQEQERARGGHLPSSPADPDADR